MQGTTKRQSKRLCSSMSKDNVNHGRTIKIGLTGDVMIGRGIDAILPNSVPPTLHENFVKDAQTYVKLAIKENGPLPLPLPLSQSEPDERQYSYIWGDLVHELRDLPDVTLVNLETALTTSDDWAKGKGIHLRSHPRNVESLSWVNAVSLANNHVLDWGITGLEDTMNTVKDADIAFAGAGRTIDEASNPVLISVSTMTDQEPINMKVIAMGFPSAGVPLSWRATNYECGVNVEEDLDQQTAKRVADSLRRGKSSVNDLSVVSIHWGGNWNWGLPEEWRQFAHQLIDNGVDLVVGHSSHHVKGIEVYKGKMIAYGLGDFLNDYEGIEGQGYEEFRHDLSCFYLPQYDMDTKKVVDIEIIPCKIKNLRVQRATDPKDIEWLQNAFTNEGKSVGTRCEKCETQSGVTNLRLRWS